MPRKPRIIAQGKTHHCFTRCHGKKNLLMGRYGRKYVIEAICMCQKIYDFRLIAAEIVANHIHLIIQTNEDKETISRIMQYIKARIAEKYNSAMNTTGPFWNERFGSTVIEDAENPEQYLLWLLWYLGYNPVRKKLCYDPRKADIGFINAYLVKDCNLPVKITLHEFFHRLGSTFEECVRKFLVWEEFYLKRIVINF